jgi:hypothetical protein
MRLQPKLWCDAGRADYFGTVSNLAARVAGLAAPGQILVEGMEAFRREKAWQRKSDAIALPPEPMSEVAKGNPGGSEGVVLEQIGYYLLKVTAIDSAHTKSHDWLVQVPLHASAVSCLPIICCASIVHRCGS